MLRLHKPKTIHQSLPLFEMHLRAYPPGFAHKILDSYESRGTVGCALRFKRKIDVSKTDRQIFEELDLGDLWLESKLHLAWFYIHGNKYLAIPESWRDTMESFHRELCARVFGLNSRLCA